MSLLIIPSFQAQIMMNTKAILSLPKPFIEDTSSSNDGSFDYNSTLNKVSANDMTLLDFAQFCSTLLNFTQLFISG